jgi:hypothetical protein
MQEPAPGALLLPTSPGDSGCSLVLLQLAILVLACQGLDGFLEAPFRRPSAARGVAMGAAALGLFGLAFAWLRPARVAAAASSADLGPLAALLDIGLVPLALGLVSLGTVMLTWRQLGVLRLKIALATIAFAEILYLAWTTAPQRTAPGEVEIVGAADARVLATDTASAAQLAQGRAPAKRVNTPGAQVLARTRAFLDLAAPGAWSVGARVPGSELVKQRFAPHLANLAQIDVLLGDSAPAVLALASPPGPEGAARADVPAARLVFTAQRVAEMDAAADDLGRRTDPAASVVLEGSTGSFTPRPPPRPATVTLVERGANHVRWRVDAGQGRGYLVMADAHAPGWHATVDGEPAAILPADVAFRAVAVPEGEHDVELVYAPWAKRWGLPLVAFGVL